MPPRTYWALGEQVEDWYTGNYWSPCLIAKAILAQFLALGLGRMS